MNKYLVAQLVANYLQERVETQKEEIERLLDVIQLHNQEIQELQDEVRRTRNYREMVGRDGSTALFIRSADGHFMEVQPEESIRSVRRRLNFDSESEGETEDEFMHRLMFGTP